MLIYNVETGVPGAGGVGRLLVPLGVPVQVDWRYHKMPGHGYGYGYGTGGVPEVVVCCVSVGRWWSLRCRFSLTWWSGTRFWFSKFWPTLVRTPPYSEWPASTDTLATYLGKWSGRHPREGVILVWRGKERNIIGSRDRRRP